MCVYINYFFRQTEMTRQLKGMCASSSTKVFIDFLFDVCKKNISKKKIDNKIKVSMITPPPQKKIINKKKYLRRFRRI